jgi:hypothetical protein
MKDGSEQPPTVRVEPPEAPPNTLRSALERLTAGLGPAPDPKRFEDRGEIARGGMATIRRLHDRAILRAAAKKQLHEAALVVPGAPQRFLEEARSPGGSIIRTSCRSTTWCSKKAVCPPTSR